MAVALASPQLDVSERPDGLDIRWASADIGVDYTENGFTLLDVFGSEIEGEPGEPGIPRVDFTVVLPLESGWNFVIDRIEWKPFVKGELAPVARWEGWPDGPFYPVFEPNDSLYKQNRWFPEKPVALEDAGFMRNIHLGRLEIHPVRYNPRKNVIERLVELECSVTYERRSSKSPFRADELESSCIASSINPAAGVDFVRARPRRRRTENIYSYADRWFTFNVQNSGLIKIDRSYISSLGYNPSDVSPDEIRVFDEGWRELSTANDAELPELEEIPLYPVGLDDGSFDSGDGLYFFARGPSDWFISDGEPMHHYHRFTTVNKYWITVGGAFPGPCRRLDEESLSVDTPSEITGRYLHHIESDQIFAKTSNDIQWGMERTDNKHITYIDDRIIPSEVAVFSYRNVPVEGEGVPLNAAYINGHAPVSSSTRYYTYTGEYDGAFSSGTNSIEIYFNGIAVLFDYYEFIYYIDLEPKSGVLTFAGSDSAAKYSFTGFSSEPLVFDVTDQTDLRLLTTTESAGSWVFSDTFADRRYYIAPLSFAQEAGSPSLVNITALRDSLFACDMIMLIPEGLESDTAQSLQEYISFREGRGVDISWVYIEDVMQEFGFGVNDPTAIRDFLKYIWNYSPDPPEYVMLVGDATWDPRGISDSPETFCPAALCVSNAPDDYFYAVTDDYTPDFAGGRVPINTINQWRFFVDKLIDYEGSPDYGPWRIRYVWCADDDRKTGNVGDTHSHTTQTSNGVISLPKWTDNRTIYMIDYPLTSTGIKPTAQKDLLDYWNDGSVLVNYIGHGNYRLLSHEQVFEATSCISKLKNTGELPLMISASCEVGLFYRTSGQCIAEQVILREGSGAHSAIAATRMTWASANGPLDYNTIHNIWDIDGLTRVGLALKLAKGTAGYGSTQGQYVLFGDPTMEIGPPSLDVVLEATPDSLVAGRLIHVTGQVQEDSTLRADFDGTAYILVYDSGYWANYYSPYIGSSVTYYTPGVKLFAGPVDVIGGLFEADFVIPLDVSFGTSDAKIVGYAYSDNEDGVGALANLYLFGDTNLVITDTTSPEIELTLEGPGFADCGILCDDGILICYFSDSNGINTSGATGHGIILTIDGNEAAAVDLSPYFTYKRNSYTEGVAVYDITQLAPGLHTIRVKAWDNMGNSGFAELTFEADDCVLALSNPLAYPNPFANETDITFTIDKPADITVNIYTLSGRLVRRLESHAEPAFCIIRWDGRDSHGTSVANGVYLAKIIAGTSDGESVSTILKIAKSR